MQRLYLPRGGAEHPFAGGGVQFEALERGDSGHGRARGTSGGQAPGPRDRIGRPLEVIDPGAGFEPLPRVAGQSQAGGWGLYLVDQIADRWGVVPGDGTHVWFELDAVDAGRESLGRAC